MKIIVAGMASLPEKARRAALYQKAVRLAFGTFEIRFQFLGYKPVSRAGVVVTAGKTTPIDVILPKTALIPSNWTPRAGWHLICWYCARVSYVGGTSR